MVPTIYALSSGYGKAGLAVIRISGPQAAYVLAKMALPEVEPRRASLRSIKHPLTGEILDKALVLYFPGPESFTGEDCVELHIHGGTAVIRCVLEALGEFEGLKMAEPGDFSRRAFHNNKLDLVEIEGLADLIEAETEAQRSQAFRQFDGELSSVYQTWRTQLVKSMALFEAGIDFVDEEDVPDSLLEPVRKQLESLKCDIENHLDDNRKGERLRDGLKLVIIGRPNVGKSSLMNLLTRRNAAIVSEQAGTTRDVIETHLDIGGYPIILTDTAGIRHTDASIEKEGISLALAEASKADLLLLLEDNCEEMGLEIGKTTSQNVDSVTIRVLNKADLMDKGEISGKENFDCVISVHSGQGVQELLDLIRDHAKKFIDTSGSPSLTRTRYRQALLSTRDNISRALKKLGSEHEELIAEDLRQAAHNLGSITGHVGVEDLLDVIFSQFCIGK